MSRRYRRKYGSCNTSYRPPAGHIEESEDEVCEVKSKQEQKQQQQLLLTLQSPLGNDDKIRWLTTLNLSNAGLKTLPESISDLLQLQHLTLDHNKLKWLPDFITDLTSLKQLSLKNNALVSVPQRMDKLTKLEMLNLENNKLNQLPAWWSDLRSLTSLNLVKNAFKQVPRAIQDGVGRLEYLDMSANKGINLSGVIFSRNLKKFIVKNAGRVEQFPRWICSGIYKDLEEINLANTYFQTIEFSGSKKGNLSIKEVNLQDCDLTERTLGIILPNMLNLEVLNIGNNKRSHQGGNHFPSLPIEHLSLPEKIVEYSINCVGLSEIPITIALCKNLTNLYLAKNSISWLPEEICDLTKLKVLVINDNILVMLPENIDKLESLKVLEIANNDISALPVTILQMKNLEFLDLYNNKIQQPPIDLVNTLNLKGLDLEFNFFETVDLQSHNYIDLRTRLRLYQNSIGRRSVGPRLVVSSNVSSSTSSSTNTIDENQLVSSVGDNQEENWDYEYSWSDDWDPWNPPALPPPAAESFYYLHRTEQTFIPSDLHPPSIWLHYRYRRANRHLFEKPIVEGQFDDAD